MPRLFVFAAALALASRKAFAKDYRRVDGFAFSARYDDMRFPKSFQACNGQQKYCALPLSLYTFAGAHASNSYALNVSRQEANATEETAAEELPEVKDFVEVRCKGSTQVLNITEQLIWGHRYLSMEVCVRDSETVACRLDPDNASRAFVGRPLELDLAEVRAFLRRAPGQVVALSPVVHFLSRDGFVADRASTSARALERWRGIAERAFGACGETRSPDDVSCMFFPKDASRITLGDVVNKNRRALILLPNALPLYTGEEARRSTGLEAWEEATGKTIDLLTSKYIDSAGREGSSKLRLLELQLFQSDISWPLRVAGKSKSWNWVCNHKFGSLLELHMPGPKMFEELEKRFKRRDKKEKKKDPRLDWRHKEFNEEECTGACGCMGYVSVIEKWHKELKRHGFNMLAVTADYPEQHELAFMHELIERMNEGNLRALSGTPEPGWPFEDCPYYLILMIMIYAVAGCCLCCCLCCTARSKRFRTMTAKCDQCCSCPFIDHDRYSDVPVKNTDWQNTDGLYSPAEAKEARKQDKRMNCSTVRGGFVPVLHGEAPIERDGTACPEKEGSARSKRASPSSVVTSSAAAEHARSSRSRQPGGGERMSSKAGDAHGSKRTSDYWPAAPHASAPPPWYPGPGAEPDGGSSPRRRDGGSAHLSVAGAGTGAGAEVSGPAGRSSAHGAEWRRPIDRE